LTDDATQGGADLPAIVALAYESALDASLRPKLISRITAFLRADLLVWLNTNGIDRESGPTALITAMREKSTRGPGFENDGSMEKFSILLEVAVIDGEWSVPAFSFCCGDQLIPSNLDT
jgi:hypothetical protein